MIGAIVKTIFVMLILAVGVLLAAIVALLLIVLLLVGMGWVLALFLPLDQFQATVVAFLALCALAYVVEKVINAVASLMSSNLEYPDEEWDEDEDYYDDEDDYDDEEEDDDEPPVVRWRRSGWLKEQWKSRRR